MTTSQLKDIARQVASGEISLGAACATYSLSSAQAETLGRLVEALDTDVKSDLLADMKKSPHLYQPAVMRALLDGTGLDLLSVSADSPLGRFAASGERLSWEDLEEAGIVAAPLTPEAVKADEDGRLPVYTITEYSGGIVPDHRTDVFLLGIAGSGKSSLACSLINELVESFDYEYQHIDKLPDAAKTDEYYAAVHEITTRFQKPVAPSLSDSLLFCPLRDTASRKRLTIIDGDSRVMADISRLHTKDSDEIRTDTVYRIMANDNSKILLFLFDYRNIKGKRQRTLFRQAMMMDSVVNALSTDGSGSDASKDCTFSRVKTVAFVFTKCDAGEENSLNHINGFLEESMRNVMMKLDVISRRYGINRENGFRPYVIPFSLGKFTVGNTFHYNPSATRQLAGLIADVCPAQWPWHC